MIVISQFAGTSLWFAGNAVLPELTQELGLSTYAVSQVSSSVMIGFIAGTLFFSILSLADRFSPVLLFFISSLSGAFFTLSIALWAQNSFNLLVFRFLTGFSLAGIYPVGMKIAADWYEKGLGKAMGYLLGALILGTAFPHLLKDKHFDLPWKQVLYFTAAFACLGGLIMIRVGNGPYRKKAGRFRWNAIPQIFSSPDWRSAAFAYFGHMWELYSFWGFLPLMIGLYNLEHGAGINIPLLSFLIIGSGTLSSILLGYLSASWGSARSGASALLLSGLCCLLSPLAFQLSPPLFLCFLFLWGFTVSPDSPQFSTLVAQSAPQEWRGTALTIYNAIGFTIATVSLTLTDYLFHGTGLFAGKNTFVWLALGALTGLSFLRRLIRK